MLISWRKLSGRIQNLILIIARTRDFGPVHLSRVTRRSESTNLREKIMRFSRVIRDVKGLILLFRPWPSLKGIFAAATHQSAPEKAEALSRYPRIMGLRLLTGTGCSLSKSASQTHAAGRFRPLPAAVPQGHLGGPCAPLRTRKGRGFVEIFANQGVAPAASSRKAENAHIRNLILRLARRSDFGPCRLSRASQRSRDTNPSQSRRRSR